MKKTFHFLGGIYFAIGLIAAAALTVIAGTIIESRTGSHLYAAEWTYSHPLFAVLLGLFFVNILFSALRRWPFQSRHIPFLITHLGLLMVIAGTIIKNRVGLQGNLSVWEGSSSDKVSLPQSYSLHVESQTAEADYPLATLEPRQTYQKDPFPELKIKIIGSTPHIREKWEGWIKGDHAIMTGMPPLPVTQWSPATPLPTPYLVPLPSDKSLWNVLAVKTDHLEELIQQYQVVGEREYPLLLLAEDHLGDAHLYLLDQHDNLHHDTFQQSRPQNIVVYGQGYGGYAVQSTLPDPSKAISKSQKHQADLAYLKKELRFALDKNPPLSPPLALIKQATDKGELDFVDAFLDFLIAWDQSEELLYSGSSPFFQFLDWNSVSLHDKQALQWIALLFDQIEGPLRSGENLIEVLERNRWPFVKELKQNPEQNPLSVISQQIFAVVQDLPPLNHEQPDGRLLSAYLKAFGIDYSTIKISAPEDAKGSLTTLETPLTIRHRPEPPSQKYEDNIPAILIEVENGTDKQKLSLAYDPSSFGFKWPILNGSYLVRFQPQHQEIPYSIRLRQARQIYYPQSPQTYSYEGDIWVHEVGKSPQEISLSMNKVHETWDGYRFYLAGMSPPNDQSSRRAQIIVNHDPAKYLLTYPGALIVSLGILLLFWMRPYSRKTPK